MTYEEIKEKYGNEDGYVYCSVCPLGGNGDDNDERDCINNSFYECFCDGRCGAYKRIRKYLGGETMNLYVNWKKKDIISEKEYNEIADVSDKAFFEWLNAKYKASNVYTMDGIDRQDVYNKFCETAKGNSEKIRSDYEIVVIEL